MNSIIEVKNLGKKYKIGEQQRYLALRDILTNIARAPLSWFGAKVKTNNNETNIFWALQDVNFNVEQGEVLGIIGRNGAGKSTLLKILSQITPPTIGEIRLRGRVGSLLEVGTGFHPELTGRENIFLNGAILGMRKKEIEKKFDEIVDFAGIEKFLDTPVKRYSSGMYVRLAFAVAAHLDPEILIVDEVLAVGDAEFQKKCLGKMNEITTQAGRTVLFVSHNLEAIRNLCSRCLVLDKGKIIFEGETNEALERYSSVQNTGDVIANKGIFNKSRRGSGTLSFTSIKIFDLDDVERNIFSIDEIVRFEMSYEIYEEMEDLYVTVCFFSSKARDLLLTDMRYEVKKGIIKKDENGTVVLEVNLNGIRPGEYILYFWIGDRAAAKYGSTVNYDLLDDMVGPLIIKSDGIEKTTGSFSLESKILC
jgi:lipopolysaccharide transport system ATP-binding protein